MTRLPAAFLILALAALPLQASADNATQARTITTTGDAEIRVVPDEILISFTAENRRPDLADAQQENDRTVKSLIAYLTNELKIESEYIQTDMVAVEPAYRQCHYDDELSGACSPLEIVYFSVRKGIQIRLKKPDLYEPVVTKALKLGVTHIDNVRFVTSELRKHRDRAREMAATAAREKADAVAGTLGMTVAKPVTIHTGNIDVFYGHNGPRRGSQTMMAQNALQEVAGSAGGNDAALALGQIIIRGQVTVTFEME